MAYWLMKSEPDTYGIDDLIKQGRGMWEGCRNYTVRNFFRDDFQIGDLAFFHHSNSKPSGVIGVMKCVSEPYADPTQFDPESHYYDPKAPREGKPRWLVVDMEFVRKFDRIVSLAELREHPVLKDMWVCRKGQRLSVMPVTEREWETLLDLPGL
ncbi:MAG: EVE domain-containing protein [Fimbriimonadaceae bacterium]|nr:EVE domain-containing protein [Fimbriimonadaceae bacterium]